MEQQRKYRETEVLTAKDVQNILKVGNKTVYRLFEKDCPFRVIKIPGGYRVHTKSFFEWFDGKSIE
ncbi:MAG: helix-turn-helix domain-containing protein [Lachnospiraceae bacterium]|nr:helix-turn-helix domain-containing protein [Lachnospiraceae bacterium]MDE7201788.1 helix-turn-helix domain-containing protein [Lachnospiraceae bacterium]